MCGRVEKSGDTVLGVCNRDGRGSAARSGRLVRPGNLYETGPYRVAGEVFANGAPIVFVHMPVG